MKSWIEVSAARLRGNLTAIRAAVGPAFEPLAVIKADAYGHGAALCAPVLVQAGAAWLGVGDLEEGVRVRAALAAAGLGDRATRLLMMCGFEPADAPGIVEAGLTPVIWSVEHVAALETAAASAGQRIAVHLEIDSGMARQGAAPDATLAAVLEALWHAPAVRLEGIFSHLSSSEAVGSTETAKQIGRFRRALEQVYGRGFLPEYVHLGNSSALDEGSTLAWTRDLAEKDRLQALVRPGLALYGYVLPLEMPPEARASGVDAGPIGHLHPRLQPVATWKTRVIGLREIAAGEPVGYGATFVAQRPMRLALLPVGYADGFRREASSGVGDGWVCLAAQRAPVVGRVSMNLTVVDVTGLAPVHEGDEVVLLGQGVTADDHAHWCRTIPYEILCGMRGHRCLV